MSDLELDPAIAKLLEYAKSKKSISFDELIGFPAGTCPQFRQDRRRAGPSREPQYPARGGGKPAGRGDRPSRRNQRSLPGKKRLVYNGQGIRGRRSHPALPAGDRQGKPPHRRAGSRALQADGGGREHHQGHHPTSGMLIPGVLPDRVKRQSGNRVRRSARKTRRRIAERRRLNQFYRDVIRDTAAGSASPMWRSKTPHRVPGRRRAEGREPSMPRGRPSW